MRKFRGTITAAVIAAVILAISYFYDGGVPRPENSEAVNTELLPSTDEQLSNGSENEDEVSALYRAYTENEFSDEGVPLPIDPDNATISDVEMVCAVSIRCDTLLDNIEELSEEKRELVPSDGVILPRTEAVFYEGESVFDVLSRQTRKNGIHLEFESTPLYGSVYIEGISNLYELDCGELSGWMYKVNGKFPGYGCSRYPLSSGDEIEWVYTCRLGKDVGNDYEGNFANE